MANGIQVRADAIRSLGFASISGVYAAVGTPFVHNNRLLKMDNLTDAVIMFSFDGINDHFIVPSQSFVLLDLTSNLQDPSGQFVMSMGTQMYVKAVGANPTLGSVYISAIFARGE